MYNNNIIYKGIEMLPFLGNCYLLKKIKVTLQTIVNSLFMKNVTLLPDMRGIYTAGTFLAYYCLFMQFCIGVYVFIEIEVTR